MDSPNLYYPQLYKQARQESIPLEGRKVLYTYDQAFVSNTGQLLQAHEDSLHTSENSHAVNTHPLVQVLQGCSASRDCHEMSF